MAHSTAVKQSAPVAASRAVVGLLTIAAGLWAFDLSLLIGH